MQARLGSGEAPANGPVHRAALPPDGTGVATNRVRFLSHDEAEPSRVRPSILASWQRSRELQVAADRIQLPYERDADFDTPLTRSAEPVLTRLAGQLSDQSVSIVLTDCAGLVLSRRTGDAELERHLDRVLLAPGFSYAEQFVGTNGIGTALEAGSATAVFGHEHYAEHLESLACAGAPIHDPISGRMLGVLDLTCWRRDAGALLLTLATNTAEAIQHAMLRDSGLSEFEVLQAYRQTCRRTTGIVFAITRDAVMLNEHARTELDAADQAALLAHATDLGTTLPPGRRRSGELALPSGAPARLYCQQVGSGAERAGLVVHVKVGQPALKPSERHSMTARMLLPGLVGEAPLWKRACDQVESTFRSGAWLALEGEAGVGKMALLRAVQLRQQPARRFNALDAAHARQDPQWMATLRTALAETGSVLISHIDQLDVRDLRAVSSALQDAKARAHPDHVWVAVTLRTDAPGADVARVLSHFPTTVTVPPLRVRPDDLERLVSFFLAKLSHGQQVTCSPAAMRLLMRSSWPGNVEQLQQLLHQVVQHRRSGAISAEDLPPEMHAISRRVLSTLESMERDAIVQSLGDTGGNKVKAARALGMSRATIYRKIREFGIITPG